jgi:hypothetical protein
MVFEMGGRVFYLGDDYFAPSWWDYWVKGNLSPYWNARRRKTKTTK